MVCYAMLCSICAIVEAEAEAAAAAAAEPVTCKGLLLFVGRRLGGRCRSQACHATLNLRDG